MTIPPARRALASIVVALACGLVFGVGLIVSGMARPEKVLAFLDVTGAWDPSLAFVMGGAIGVAAVAFAVARRRTSTWLGAPLELVRLTQIDARLALGSVSFGVGWGLVGFCPGPAIVAVGAGSLDALIFVGAMLGGMGVYRLVERARLAPLPDGRAIASGDDR